MPEYDKEAAHIIKIYQRSKSWNTLPFPGCLLEQPAYAMEMFDVIDEAIAEEKENRKREEQSKLDFSKGLNSAR